MKKQLKKRKTGRPLSILTTTTQTSHLLGAPSPGFNPNPHACVNSQNAPTALFHLLDIIDAGAPKPAAIVGFPVGFVGAAESKDQLIANARGIPFIALRGRQGGSAMAAAVVNALLGGNT